MACEFCVDYVHDLGSGHPPNNFSVILIASPTDTAHPLLESMDRSPLLLSADDSALLIVDVQEKFLPVLPDTTSLLWNLQRLGEAARGGVLAPAVGVEVAPVAHHAEQVVAVPAQGGWGGDGGGVGWRGSF